MKKIITMLIILAMVLSSFAFAESYSTKVEENNQEIIYDVKPTIIEELLLVPVRAIFESLDLEVSWDGTTRTVTGKNEDTLIKLQIGDDSATINGRLVRLDAPAVIINNRTMVPARLIGKLTGVEVSWDENTNLLALVPKAEHKELGEIESIIGYGTSGLIGAHYPVFDKSNVDAKNKELVTSYIEEFKDEIASNSFQDNDDYKYELSIDYETYSGPSDIVSIIFNITESSSYLAHPDVKVETRVYDLSNDKEVELDDIMDGEYLEHISQISENYFSTHETYKDNTDSSIFEEGIYPSIENYSNFILKEDKIAFTFKKYQLFSGNFGMPSIEIPYSEMKDYIKPSLLETPTEEENPEDTDEDSDQPIVEAPNRVVDPNKPMIALTFDDGPNKNVTIPILDTLKEYDSVATFFVLGNRVSYNTNILERMLEEGNEIGNHTYNHKELTKLSSAELTEQIINTQNAVINAIGIEPKLMRPTYGSYNNELKTKIDMPLILWSVDTEDWKSRDSKIVTKHVLENVKDGDVILMHDMYNSTAEAVKSLVPQLINRGYQLVTVSELFESRGEIFQDGQIYFRMRKK